MCSSGTSLTPGDAEGRLPDGDSFRQAIKVRPRVCCACTSACKWAGMCITGVCVLHVHLCLLLQGCAEAMEGNYPSQLGSLLRCGEFSEETVQPW